MSVGSSPDPLALPMDSSPVRRIQRRHGKGPLSPRSVNISSPSKSVYLEGHENDDGQPWRIKVTVQAEPPSPQINRNVVRTSRALSKQAENSSPVKRAARRTRRSVSSPAKEDRIDSATPASRRKNSVQTHDLIEIPDDPVDDYSLSDIEAESHTEMTAKVIEPKRDQTANRVHVKRASQPISNASDLPTHSRAISQPPLDCPREEFHDDGAAIGGAQDPGEATVLESEEFSMISVDSLSSNTRVNDQLSPAMLSAPSRKQMLANKSADVSFMPSSPPTIPPAYRRTPLPSDSPPKYPAAPAPPSVQHEKIETPLQESARKSGRALQDVLSDFNNDPITMNAIFSGFSAGTRRQLRESLYAGQTLATPQLDSRPNFGLGVQGAPHFAAPVPTFSSPFHSPARRQSDAAAPATTHRLPTPEEQALSTRSQPLPNSFPQPAAEQVLYPSIPNKTERTTLASPYLGYDAMSWTATAASRPIIATKSPLRQATTQSQEDPISNGAARSESHGETDQLTSEQCGNNVDVSRPETSQVEKSTEEDEASKDIWQEEASRLNENDDDHTPPILRDDLPIKPRRSKLPRTWRRNPDTSFHYSDSPEPEDLANRKVSATTNASGIMTPPITEDEQIQDGVMTPSSSETGKGARVEDNRKLSTVCSKDDSVSSDDDEDTGVFWQNNLPAVYGRPPRPRRARTVMPLTGARSTESSPRADESPYSRSSFVNTTSGSSPQRKARPSTKMGGIRRNPQSDSALMTSPLKQSLLKSSKLRATPPGSTRDQSKEWTSLAQQTALSPLAESDQSRVNVTSSSLASDARQLQEEFTQQMVGGHSSNAIDLTQMSSRCSETDVSRSYVEELNHDSPTKIRVNFNDSSAHESGLVQNEHDDHGRSMLISLKKKYPPLFDNASSTDSKDPDTEKHEDAAQGKSRVRKGGFVSRLTDSLWDAVTVPPPYVDSKPTIVVSPSLERDPSEAAISSKMVSGPSVGTSVPDHVLRLRRKYGLLPHVHPFTYQHVRTLHRMLNSARSRSGSSSIIPASGHLPADLQDLVGKTRKNELDQSFTWTPRYAHVVDSFMSLLLPPAERRRTEEHTGRQWGDDEALRYAGKDSKGRHGSDKVYARELQGNIESLWIAGIVEDIVWKEEMNAKKKKVQDMLARAERAEKLEKVRPA